MRDVEHPLFIFINSSSHECRNRQDCFGVKIVWIIDHSAVRQIDIPGSINICLTVKLVTFQFGCKSRKERKASERTHTKHVFMWCQTPEFQVSNFEVLLPKWFKTSQCSSLLNGKMFSINKKGTIIRNMSHFRAIFRLKWKNLRRIILFQKLGEDYALAKVQFEILLSRCSTTWLEAQLPKSWITLSNSS